MRLLNSTVVALCLLLPSCTKYAEYKGGFAGATGGERLERALWDAVQKKDWKALDKHLGSSFLMVTPWAVMDRAVTLEHLKKIDLVEYSIAEMRIEANGPDAVVAYTFTARGMVNGEPMNSAPMRMVTVWQQVPKGWIAVVHSEMVQQSAQ